MKLSALLAACALSGAVATSAYAAPPLTNTQLQALACVSAGTFAQVIYLELAGGTSLQNYLDDLDRSLAASPKDPVNIQSHSDMRRMAIVIARHPHWNQAQTRASIEAGCLRGEYK